MKHLLIALVKGYRLFFSAWVGAGCRFEPTCSQYSLEALQKHGAARGAWLTTKRLARCHPGCQGGYDPVPDLVSPLTHNNHRFFTHLLAPKTQPDIQSRVDLKKHDPSCKGST